MTCTRETPRKTESGCSLESKVSFIKEEVMNRCFVLKVHNFLSEDMLYECIVTRIGSRKISRAAIYVWDFILFRASNKILLVFKDHEFPVQ